MRCLLPALALWVAATVAASANLLLNPGFENAFDSWDQEWTPTESGSQSTPSAKRSGLAGAWVYTAANSAPEAFSCLRQRFAATAGRSFRGSAFIQTPAPGQWVDWVSGSHASVRILFLAASGSTLAVHESPQLTTGNTPYDLPFDVTTAPAPAGTAFVEFQCYLHEPAGDTRQSVANFDDCSLEELLFVPQLAVSPAVLGFGTDLQTRTLSIRNSGEGTLNWNISADRPWIYSGKRQRHHRDRLRDGEHPTGHADAVLRKRHAHGHLEWRVAGNRGVRGNVDAHGAVLPFTGRRERQTTHRAAAPYHRDA